MGAPIIMVHGAFCGGWAFDAFRGAFERAGHTVIAPDLRGHGENRRGLAGVSMAETGITTASGCPSCGRSTCTTTGPT